MEKLIATCFLVLTIGTGFLFARTTVNLPWAVTPECQCIIHRDDGTHLYGVFAKDGECAVKTCFTRL